MPVITTIDDLRDLAQRRVPKMFFDYADSGSYTEQTLRDNTSDFDKIRLRQRVAVDMEGRSLATQMVGEDVSMPLALAQPDLIEVRGVVAQRLLGVGADVGVVEEHLRHPALGDLPQIVDGGDYRQNPHPSST